MRVCLAVILLAVVRSGNGQGNDCNLQNDCACSMSDGSGAIDLTSLGNTDSTPRFKDFKQSEEGYYYSYNPCGGFTEGDCTNAAACVLDQDKSQSQQIGDNGRAAFKFDDDSGNVIAAYTAGTGVLKLTTVNLICDKSACDPVFKPLGEQGPQQFEMTLTTVCACPGMCTSSGPKSCSSSGGLGGLSGGSILLIAAFTLLVIYLVAGIVFMKVARNAAGLDLVPNKIFWSNLPIFIKDGFRFTIAKILRRDSPSYDKI